MTTSSSNKNIKNVAKSVSNVLSKFSFKSPSKKKSIFCRSVVGNGVCGARHGEACAFAHTVKEINPIQCRFGRTCKFYQTGKRGTTCAFVHPGESFDSYVSRQGFPIENRKRTSSSDSIHLNSISKGGFVIPQKVTIVKVEKNDEWPSLSTVPPPPSLKSWGPTKKDVKHDSICKDPKYTKTLVIDRSVLEKLTSDKNINDERDLSLYNPTPSCRITSLKEKIKNIEKWTLTNMDILTEKESSFVRFEVDKIDFSQKGDKLKPRRLSADEKKMLPESYIMCWQDSFNRRSI